MVSAVMSAENTPLPKPYSEPRTVTAGGTFLVRYLLPFNPRGDVPAVPHLAYHALYCLEKGAAAAPWQCEN